LKTSSMVEIIGNLMVACQADESLTLPWRGRVGSHRKMRDGVG
jgi:hypothetical protein